MLEKVFRHLIRRPGPYVDDFIVPLTVGDNPFLVQVPDLFDFGIRFSNQVFLLFGNDYILDPDGNSIADWRVFAAPSNCVIDPQGKIRYTLFGGVDWDSEELVKERKALAVKK